VPSLPLALHQVTLVYRFQIGLRGRRPVSLEVPVLKSGEELFAQVQ
jgi:hypothetical protein